jgi:hypothetical protein
VDNTLAQTVELRLAPLPKAEHDAFEQLPSSGADSADASRANLRRFEGHESSPSELIDALLTDHARTTTPRS